jgi:LacI family transcriptional regulator
VIGFDDVLAASTYNPPLTTIRQPLRDMGQAAASTLLGLIRDEIPHPHPAVITVYPSLVVRKSTAQVAVRTKMAKQVRPHRNIAASHVAEFADSRWSP